MADTARPTRADEVRKERRRKRGSTIITGQKLGVNEALLDRKNFEYRWINDKPGRINAMTTDDDWDLVTDPSKAVKGDGTNEGGLVSINVGAGENNQPLKAYLARKAKDLYAEDQDEKRENLDRMMGAIKRGKQEGPEAHELAGHRSYVPEGGITIQDDRRR